MCLKAEMQRPHLLLSHKGIPTLALALAVGSCASSEAPPVQAPHETVHAAQPPKKKGMAVSGQLGSLDQRKIDQTFAAIQEKLGGCLVQGSSRVEFLGGHVKFFLRIALDGSVKWAYLSESTLGDRDTERCMLGIAKGTHWPPPVDGEGQAQKGLDFDSSPDVRTAVGWGPERAMKPLNQARAKLGQCSRSAPGKYKATVYVQTDGSPLAAGIAPPDERGEGGPVDCMVDVLKGLKFASPGSWPAKVSFDIE